MNIIDLLKKLISSLQFDDKKCLTESKSNHLSFKKGDTSTATTRTNVLELMQQFRSASEDGESLEMSDGLCNLSLISNQNGESESGTSQELLEIPVPPVEDFTDSNKLSSMNKTVAVFHIKNISTR